MQTLTLTVKICIGDKVQDSLITFTSLKRPLDTVKEEVAIQELMKRGMSLDPYRLVTTRNVLVSDFASIEGQPLLVFHIPEKIVPLSGNEWTKVQLDQLKIVFEDVDLVGFFSNAEFQQFEMSDRGAKLVKLLCGIDDSLHRKYLPEGEGRDLIASTRAIRENPLLQHPICKALFAARKYVKHESFIDDFVKHLLDEMGFNEGSLYAAPQMRINLCFGDTEKTATADITIIDLLSYARIGVVEDKNWKEMMLNYDSTAQLVAEGIAITQRNEVVERQKHGYAKAEADCSFSSETVYGIRVTGSLFHFYALQISPEIHSAMRNLTAAVSRTTMYRYKSEAGLDFMVKEERSEIILMLSLLQEIAKRTGETTR